MSQISDSTQEYFLGEGPAIVVLMPDLRSILALGLLLKRFAALESKLGHPVSAYFLLTQFDPLLPAHEEMRQRLTEQLCSRLLPFAIRRSDRFAEALAEGGTMVDAPGWSQMAEPFFDLAKWLRIFFEHFVSGGCPV
jgi:cellulose biosynthesis protein BcsQ